MKSEPPAEKQELRRRMIEVRSAIPDSVFEDIGRSIVRRMIDHVRDSRATTVLAYWTLPGSREIDLRPGILSLLADGITVGLPVVNADRNDRTLTFRLFDDPEDLERGPFGTLHPSGERPIDPRTADLIIVPALAADRDRFRLGWGGGYYDRLLARVEIDTWCPVCSACLVDSLPRESHDRRVSIIVTETETIGQAARP